MKNCPFCGSAAYTKSYFPDTVFNNKNFSYLLCSNCNLVYLDPFPTADDYVLMYPPSYQSGINSKIVPDRKKLPGLRFAYKKHFDLVQKYAPGKRILDYGCGQANFVVNALHAGFQCDGAEYNPVHVELLRKEIPGSNFYLLDEFHSNESLQYDVIRLSNVLEHLDKPGEIVRSLMKKLSPGGILLVEGPIETNFSLAFLSRKLYFQSTRNRKVSHTPTHIFFSNAKNQRQFFDRNALAELYFEVKDNEWPYPESSKDLKGAGDWVKFIIARASMFVSAVARNWGNTFIYVGKRK